MKIDAHQHFWQYSPVKQDWISDDMPVLKQDFLPTDLAPLLEKAGFAGSVAVQAAQSEEETDFLLKLAAQYPDIIKGVVGWINLQTENIEDRLAFFARDKNLKGVRHVVQAEPDDRFLLRPAFLNGVSLLRQFNLTYDILIYPTHLSIAAEFVAHFPDQPFVLDHLAKPFIKDKQVQPWLQNMKDLARHQHVLCKLSGLVTEADWQDWRPKDFKPYLESVLEAFGPDRLMIGSDWPVCTLAGSYSEIMDIVQDFFKGLSPDEQQKILGGNAVKFYNLNIK